MSLRINTDRQFTATVHTSDGFDFKATFRIIPDEDILGLALGEPGEAGRLAEIEFLTMAVVDLDDILDADGRAMPVADAMHELMRRSADRSAMLRAYNAGLSGAKAGN